MEYKHKKDKVYEKNPSENEVYRHITPLFSALNSSGEGSSVLSACERPCVCICVCRHGKASSLDFEKQGDLEKSIGILFKKALVA